MRERGRVQTQSRHYRTAQRSLHDNRGSRMHGICIKLWAASAGIIDAGTSGTDARIIEIMSAQSTSRPFVRQQSDLKLSRSQPDCLSYF